MKKYYFSLFGIILFFSVEVFVSAKVNNVNSSDTPSSVSIRTSIKTASQAEKIIKGNIMVKNMNSKIEKVTVYSDRAMITRVCEQVLEAGEHNLIFGNIPNEIDQNSIQVQGTGDAVLKDIQIKPAYFSEIQGQEEKKLYAKKHEIEDTLRETTDRQNQIKNEKKFIEGITVKLTSSNEKSAPAELNPEKWVSMVKFYRTRQEELDKELRDTEKNLQNIRNQLEQIKLEISHISEKKNKSKFDIHVLIQKKNQGSVKLLLSYIVYNTSWVPYYDLRVSTEERKLYISYHAMIRQNTGENWDNVELSLSTAKPNIGGQHPELSPWRISRYIPMPASAPMRSESFAKKKSEMKQMMNVMPDEEDSVESGYAKEAPEPAILAENAAVSAQTTSVVFQIPGLNTIPGNQTDHKVTVMLKDFNVNFRYSAVPKLMPFAYLKAKSVNQTEYPLLSGSTNIFLNNNFVGNSHLENVAPGQEFWTFLGIDEEIKVEHKLLKKDVSGEGMFTKVNKVTYDFLIQITNNKKHEEEIVLWDQLPISENKDIKIELIEPAYQKDTEKLKKNELEYLEWIYKIKPGEKIKLPLKFSVTYPADYKVTGLE